MASTPGSAISCQLPNWNEMILLFLAASRLGAVINVSEFPMTPSGKIQKYRLREMVHERLAAESARSDSP